MRLLIGLLLPAAWLFGADPATAPSLQQVHSVYLLPMGNSLDQYLANRLTTTGLFQVVTDPQKADAIFTDAIGEGLQRKLEELYPAPTVKPKEKDKNDKDALEKPPQRTGSFSRGRGTVFLVDRNTRAVLWSVYWPVKSSRPDDTNRRATDIVKRLEKVVKGPKVPSK